MSAAPLETRDADVEEKVVLDDDHPWPGLASFDESNSDYFRGRDTEEEELFRLVTSSLVTLLYGVAGLGKTSLLQAGLFPRLRGTNWLPVPVRLELSPDSAPLVDQVFHALTREAKATSSRIPDRVTGETLWEFFHRRDALFWNDRHRIVRPVLVFDQFEELFTLGKDARGRAEFITQLSDLGEGRPPAKMFARSSAHVDAAERFDPERHRYAIVLSLREDYRAELDALRRMPSLGSSKMRLLRMNGASALKVLAAGSHIVKPATQRAIVNFVATGDPDSEQELSEMEIDPALLSVVCAELNEKRLHAKPAMPEIDRTLLEKNRDSIIRDFYENAIHPFDARVRKFVEDGLLTPDGYRASVTEDQAKEQFGVDAVTIRRLVRRRLVRIEARGRAKRIELTHDLLTNVIARSRASRKEAERERAEIEKEEALQREKSVRFRLRITGAALVVAFLALLAALIVYRNWRADRDKSAQDRAAWSLRAGNEHLANDRLPEALANIAYAVRTDPRNAVARRLAMNLLLYRMWYVPRRVWRSEEPVSAVALSDDAERFLAVTGTDVYVIDARSMDTRQLKHEESVSIARFLSHDRIITAAGAVIRIWDGNSATAAATWTEESDVEDLTVAPDGASVAIVTDSHVLLRDLKGAERFASDASALDVIRFTRDGRAVAIINHSRVPPRTIVTLRDTRTGARLEKPLVLKIDIAAADVDPDGRRLIVAGEKSVEVHSLDGLWAPKHVYDGAIDNVVFNARGDRALAVVSGVVHVWDVDPSKTPEAEEESDTTFGEAVAQAHFASDGLRVLTTNTRGQVRVWDSANGRPLSASIYHDLDVTAAEVTPDARAIATASGRFVRLFTTPGTLRIVLPGTTGAYLSENEATFYARFGTRVDIYDAVNGSRRPIRPIEGTTAFVVLPDDSHVLTKTSETWSIYDPVSGRSTKLDILPGTTGATAGLSQTAIATSRDGKRILLYGFMSRSLVADIYDVATGTRVRRLTDFSTNSRIFRASLSFDGSRALFTTTRGEALVADVATGQFSAMPDKYTWIEFDRHARRVIAATGRTVRMFDVATKKPLGPALLHAADVRFARFSPDPAEKYIATVSRDRVAQVWESSTGKTVGPPLRHLSDVLYADFAPSVQWVMTSTFVLPRQTRVWDVETGVPVTTTLSSGPHRAQFGAKGRRLIIRDGSYSILELADATAAEAPLLASLAEEIAGLRLDDYGSPEKITQPASVPVPEALRRGAVAALVECFAADGAGRRLTPFTKTTVKQYTEAYLRQFVDKRDTIATQLALAYPGSVAIPPPAQKSDTPKPAATATPPLSSSDRLQVMFPDPDP
jgi:WD40 repeat protein